MSEKIFFADCEGDNYLEDIETIWTIQIAQDTSSDVEVFADQPGYPSLKQGMELLMEADKIVFHNAFGFDFWALNKVTGKAHNLLLDREQMIDSLIMSRLMDSTSKRHSLAELGERLGFPKGSHHDFSQFSEEMVKYGKQDVRILQEAWKKPSERKRPSNLPSFGLFYENFREACELEFYTGYVIEKQVHHGFRFDFEKAQMLESELRHDQKKLERDLQKIFPPITHERWSEKTGKRLKDKIEVFNPGSRDQIASRLIDKYGWKPEAMTPTKKPKIDETILIDLPYPEAQAMAQFMTLGKKLGQIADGENAWLKKAQERSDGTYYIHGRVNILGARTHRMSHFGPNVAQVDSDSRMRSLWLPDPDDYLIGVDAEGLELRELAHFLYPYDDGLYVEGILKGSKEDGTDIHSMNRNAAGLYLRDSAKTMIYAHNYGCFDKKLGQIVIDDARKAGKEIPSGSLSAIGGELRSKIEVGIVGLGELIAKCKRSHNKNKALPGHDSRWIPSASDHSALNTLLQGNGSIVMKKALVIFDSEIEKLQLLDKVKYCANVHDEFQLSVHPDLVTYHGDDEKGKPIYTSPVAELGRESIAKAGEALGLRCPLLGSADIGKSWAETH